MEIVKIAHLFKMAPAYFSPSKLSWILRCPVRARYEDPRNGNYRGDFTVNFTALLGNIVHQVLEQSNLGRIRSETDFEICWDRCDQRQHPGGIKGRVRNYGLVKYHIGRQAIKPIGWGSGNGKSYGEKIEEVYADESLGIKGRPDLVIFRDGVPKEVKDYKTGNLFESDGEADKEYGYEQLKEDYRQQLLTYALLVYSKYKAFPEKMSVVGMDGRIVSASCRAEDIQDLRNRLIGLRERVATLADHELANASPENCRHCIYRPGCEFSVGDPSYFLKDLRGVIDHVSIPDFGNFVVVLSSGQKVFCRSNADQVGLDGLVAGLQVYLSKLSERGASGGFFTFTNYSRIYLLDF